MPFFFAGPSSIMNKQNVGHQVTILGGELAGSNAWLNTDMEETRCFLYLWVQQVAGGPCLNTRVSKENVTYSTTPKSYGEAILFQLPDIYKKMNTLAKEAARCRLNGSDQETEEFVGLFRDMIGTKFDALKKDKRARFYDVEWTAYPDDNISMSTTGSSKEDQASQKRSKNKNKRA